MLSISRARQRQLCQLRQLQRLQPCLAAASTSPASSRLLPATTATAARTLFTHTSQSRPTFLPSSAARTFSTTPRRCDAPPPPPPPSPSPLDLDRIVALVAAARDRLLSHPGIPPESETAAALRVCAEAADLVMETAPRATALVDGISDAAFAMADDPRVFLTAPLLAQYVHIQARLGRPESLPRILEAYATRPLPGGHKKQSPRDVRSAVAPDVADAALDTALAAKNLDAAVGVVEWTYAAPAFARYKLLRRGLLPAFVVVGVPMATYIAAEQLAAYQQTMDTHTATGLAFAAILSYIGFTGAIGVVANATANDQMRRVTWAPGTALRERWLREEEREALDKVACAFGFREAHRYGEEEGAEFQALREYIMSKGMLMDQVELMEGMSS